MSSCTNLHYHGFGVFLRRRGCQSPLSNIRVFFWINWTFGFCFTCYFRCSVVSLSRFPYVEIVVFVYMPYYNLFEHSRYLWRSGRNSRQHELILKSVGMSWKVASSMQIDSCGWPQLVKWLATIWLLPHERFRFIFLSSFWSLPCSCSVLRVILKAFGLTMSSWFLFYGLLGTFICKFCLNSNNHKVTSRRTRCIFSDLFNTCRIRTLLVRSHDSSDSDLIGMSCRVTKEDPVSEGAARDQSTWLKLPFSGTAEKTSLRFSCFPTPGNGMSVLIEWSPATSPAELLDIKSPAEVCTSSSSWRCSPSLSLGLVGVSFNIPFTWVPSHLNFMNIDI